MLLHDFLRRKSAILTKAKVEIDNLLTEIDDPKMKAAVDDWKPGDPISDHYAQVDQPKAEDSIPDAKAPEVQTGSLVSDTHVEDHVADSAKTDDAASAAVQALPVSEIAAAETPAPEATTTEPATQA